MKHTKRICTIIFRQEMEPCPKCGGYNLKYQTPIKRAGGLRKPLLTKELLVAWVKSVQEDGGELQGPCYIMCFDCWHRGPSLDCTGRKSTDVGRDPEIARKIKELWNSQLPKTKPITEKKV